MTSDECVQVIKSEIVLWTAGFVLMTLLINGSFLPLILRKTGLSKGNVNHILSFTNQFAPKPDLTDLHICLYSVDIEFLRF